MSINQFLQRFEFSNNQKEDLLKKFLKVSVQQPTEQDFSRFTISWIRHNLTCYEAKLQEAREKDPENFQYHYKQIRALATAKALQIFTKLKINQTI